MLTAKMRRRVQRVRDTLALDQKLGEAANAAPVAEVVADWVPLRTLVQGFLSYDANGHPALNDETPELAQQVWDLSRFSFRHFAPCCWSPFIPCRYLVFSPQVAGQAVA